MLKISRPTSGSRLHPRTPSWPHSRQRLINEAMPLNDAMPNALPLPASTSASTTGRIVPQRDAEGIKPAEAKAATSGTHRPLVRLKALLRAGSCACVAIQAMPRASSVVVVT